MDFYVVARSLWRDDSGDREQGVHEERPWPWRGALAGPGRVRQQCPPPVPGAAVGRLLLDGHPVPAPDRLAAVYVHDTGGFGNAAVTALDPAAAADVSITLADRSTLFVADIRLPGGH
ncbi:hypothetical protein [Herbidospora sp. RD11066]